MRIIKKIKYDMEFRFFCIVIFAIVVVSLLAACVTQKQRERILKDCVTSSFRKDSVALIINERLVPYIVHDSIPYFLPNPCAELCDSLGNLKKSFNANLTSDKGTKVNLSVKNNKLVINDNISGLTGTVVVKDTTQNRFTTIKEQVHENCKLEHLTKWDSFWIRCGQIFCVIILIFILYFLIKFILPKL